VYWNGTRPWFRTRKPDTSELQYQIDNWYHFNWLSGDHIVEQHVHNIDIANWLLERLPESAYGVGGQQDRKPGQSSEIYDHHAVNFVYPGGVRIASQCRQFPGGDGRVTEEFQGTKGYVKIGEITDYKGNVLWKFDGKSDNPYQVEHDELHDAIRNDKPLNNAVYGTTSSFSAVLARTATYTGKQWGYQQSLELENRTMPENLAWDSTPPVMPDKDGNFDIVQDRRGLGTHSKRLADAMLASAEKAKAEGERKDADALEKAAKEAQVKAAKLLETIAKNTEQGPIV
jgi:hypothetical protein